MRQGRRRRVMLWLLLIRNTLNTTHIIRSLSSWMARDGWLRICCTLDKHWAMTCMCLVEYLCVPTNPSDDVSNFRWHEQVIPTTTTIRDALVSNSQDPSQSSGSSDIKYILEECTKMILLTKHWHRHNNSTENHSLSELMRSTLTGILQRRELFSLKEEEQEEEEYWASQVSIMSNIDKSFRFDS